MNLPKKQLEAIRKRVEKDINSKREIPFAKCFRCKRKHERHRTDVYFICSECSAKEKVEMAGRSGPPDTGPTFADLDAGDQAEAGW